MGTVSFLSSVSWELLTFCLVFHGPLFRICVFFLGLCVVLTSIFYFSLITSLVFSNFSSIFYFSLITPLVFSNFSSIFYFSLITPLVFSNFSDKQTNRLAATRGKHLYDYILSLTVEVCVYKAS
jgi:hypothetical protein